MYQLQTTDSQFFYSTLDLAKKHLDKMIQRCLKENGQVFDRSDKVFYFKKTNQSFLQIKPLFRFILETPNIFDDSKIDVLKVEINEIIN
jgi:tRNA G46 methylase TrmB